MTQMRTCVKRQAPFGAPDWVARMATSLGLESTLRARGRPHKPTPRKVACPLLESVLKLVEI